MGYIQLKPTMRYATQNNGTAVVVKLLRPGSDELLILQHLHLINSPDNHTIPLFGTLNLNVGTLIVLPEAIPLGYGFEHEMFRGGIADFIRQLVTFLHPRYCPPRHQAPKHRCPSKTTVHNRL
jgi:hypothetical protein